MWVPAALLPTGTGVQTLIAVFPNLADAVHVKRGDQLCETVSQSFIQPDKVVRPMGSGPRLFLDFDDIGQNWEDSNKPVKAPTHIIRMIGRDKNPSSAQGMITLRLRSGGLATDVHSVVVQRLSVRVFMGTSFINRHVEALNPCRQRVKWSTDASVPIVSRTACGKRERRRSPSNATVRLAQRQMLPPRSRTAMLVTADLAVQVLVTPYNRLNKRHRVKPHAAWPSSSRANASALKSVVDPALKANGV